MARYIDADELIEIANNMGFRGNKHGEVVKVYVDACPTADVRPNVKGEWRKVADKAEHITYECVFCGAKVHVARNVATPNFCNRCGADMRGKLE